MYLLTYLLTYLYPTVMCVCVCVCVKSSDEPELRRVTPPVSKEQWSSSRDQWTKRAIHWCSLDTTETGEVLLHRDNSMLCVLCC